ncbi:hypothetical protein SD80_030380 [Scytonema tolypothrichoides VB-61278]|nr:hypothetical protein SD80_030380 [Scytonema tolypothrichoides VB-61278]
MNSKKVIGHSHRSFSDSWLLNTVARHLLQRGGEVPQRSGSANRETPSGMPTARLTAFALWACALRIRQLPGCRETRHLQVVVTAHGADFS